MNEIDEIPDEITIHTPKCIVCDGQGLVTMPRAAYFDWRDGAFIQDAWPQATATERELLISGTHPECWNLTFGEEHG